MELNGYRVEESLPFRPDMRKRNKKSANFVYHGSEMITVLERIRAFLRANEGWVSLGPWMRLALDDQDRIMVLHFKLGESQLGRLGKLLAPWAVLTRENTPTMEGFLLWHAGRISRVLQGQPAVSQEQRKREFQQLLEYSSRP